MLRQALHSRGSAFSKIYRPRHSEIQRCAITSQHRAFHIFPNLRYDDSSSYRPTSNSRSSYGPTSNGNSSYGTTPSYDTSHNTSSKPRTSFRSITSTLEDGPYTPISTSPSSNSSTTTRYKTYTQSTTDPDTPHDHSTLKKLTDIHSQLQHLTTKIDILATDPKSTTTTPSPPRKPTHPLHPAVEPLLPPPKKFPWEEEPRRKRSLPFAFWENAYLCVMFAAGVSYICTISEIKQNMRRLEKAVVN